MDYKDDFNEWYMNLEENNNREPTLDECESFRVDWLDGICEFADNMRKI